MTPPTKQSMEQAGLVELCSGCEMAGRMCDDCLDYPQARINIARALDAAREEEREQCARTVEGHLVGPLAAGPYDPHRYCCDMAYAIRARGAK